MDPGFSNSNAPLNVYFESSVLMAKIVREMSLDKTSAGILLMLAHHGILDGEPLREAAIHAMERVD